MAVEHQSADECKKSKIKNQNAKRQIKIQKENFLHFDM